MTMPRETPAPVLNTTRARQGRLGKPVFWVLLIGTVLSAIGMLLAWSWRSSVEGPPGTGQERVAPDSAPVTSAPVLPERAAR